MRGLIALITLLLFALFFSNSSLASMNISPLEISITMDEDFIHGNTSKKIIVKNNDEASINVSWYIEHPNPISLMRSNKTCISDLSWVDVDPSWSVILSGGSADFYIHLDVPEGEENKGQHWETWVTFKQEQQGFINVENAVRVYIDTPPSNVSSQIDQLELSLSVFVLVVAVVVVFFVVGFLIYKRR